MSDPLVELEKILPQIAPAVERKRLGEILGRTAEKLGGSEYVITFLLSAGHFLAP